MAMEAAATNARALPRRSLGGLIAISIFWFALNFHWQALLGLVIPGQVYGLLFREAPVGTLAAQASWVNDHVPLTLALIEVPGLIIALLANPFFGLLSDRTPGALGRRRPYILAGTAVNVVGLAVMALAPTAFIVGGSGNALAPSVLVLLAGLLLTQLANNAAAAPFHALLPDLVPQEQRGRASGFMGLAQLLGTIGGALVPALFGFNSAALLKGAQTFAAYNTGIVRSYAVVAGVIVAMAALTAFTVRERPWSPATRAGSADRAGEGERGSAERILEVTPTAGHTWRDLIVTLVAVVVVVVGGLALLQARLGLSLTADSLNVVQLIAVVVAAIGAMRAFDFRPRRHPDFSWVLATRLLVMMGIYIVYGFLLLYMQNVANAANPEAATSTFLIILTITAAISTAFAGWASDRLGRKRMVYLSGSFMAVVGGAFVLAPYILPGGILNVIFVAGAFFGLGYGAYIAVDWALVADVLPSEETFARDMGVWNIVFTIPQALAVVFGAWLLALGLALGSRGLGYTFLFISFAIFCVLGTVTVRYIKGVK
jgi:MFS family permease